MRWCPDGKFLTMFLRPVFAASRVQHVSDMRLKCTLIRPHHVYGSVADIQSATAEIRRGKEKKKKKIEQTTG